MGGLELVCRCPAWTAAPGETSSPVWLTCQIWLSAPQCDDPRQMLYKTASKLMHTKVPHGALFPLPMTEKTLIYYIPKYS